jgi:hypothetical protein
MVLAQFFIATPLVISFTAASVRRSAAAAGSLALGARRLQTLWQWPRGSSGSSPPSAGFSAIVRSRRR